MITLPGVRHWSGYIRDIKGLEGKTIESITELDCGERWGLIFTDGSFCIIQFDHGWEAGEGELELRTHVEIGNGKDAWYLKEMGIISTEQYEEMEKNRELAEKSRELQRQREEYERLKKQFE